MMVTGTVVAGTSMALKLCRKKQDDDEYEDGGYKQRHIYGRYGLPHESRCIEPDFVCQPLRELFAHVRDGLVDVVGHFDGIGVGQGKNDNLCRFMAGEEGEVSVVLLAEVHMGYVAHADDLRGQAGAGFNDDVAKLAHVGKPAKRVDGELKRLVGGNGRAAELSGDDLYVLPLHRGHNVRCGEAVILELIGIEPDSHAVWACAEDPDLADAGEACEGVLQIDDRVVGEKNSSNRSSGE